MKRQFGTHMMAYPQMSYQIKGDRFSVSFTFDSRRGSKDDLLRAIESLPGVKVMNK
jgi:hypothetical protein